MQIDRRALLAGLLLQPVVYAAPRHAAAQSADALVILLSDLHSANASAPRLLAAIGETLAARPGAPTLIAINGDVFERGNAVALRSGGALDWLLLERLRAMAPVVLNLGNHEGALVDDISEVVVRAEAMGIAVVSTLKNKSDGQPLAPARRDISNRGARFVTIGIATDEAMTYRQPIRDKLIFPEPVDWAGRNLPRALDGDGIRIVLSHAGVAADRNNLPLLPDGTLMLGGHEHLTFQHAAGRTRYLHLGAWNRAIGVVSISQSAGRLEFETRLVAIDRRGPGDPELSSALEALRRKHLTEQDRAPLARLAAPISLDDAAQVLLRAMARAAGTEFAAISHTTLGDGFPAGEVTAGDLAAFIRFDGGLVRGELDADAMAALLGRANQERELGLGNRTGDFVHANVEPLAAGRRYRLATIGWVQQNAKRYLGTEAIAFKPVPDRQLREIMLKALNGLG